MLKKTLDKNKMIGDNSKQINNCLVDILVLSQKDGVLSQHFVKADVIDAIIKELNVEEEQAEKDKK